MILVDSNVLLDIFTVDPKWFEWSCTELANGADYHELVINDFIYTEISIGFKKIETLEEILSDNVLKIMPMPRAALFLAGKAFLQYKSSKGNKNSVLPDFFIGAHASILDIPLLTRDVGRYKTYFPQLQLIAP